MSLRFPLRLWLAGSLLLAGVLQAQSRRAGSEQTWMRLEERSNGTRVARPDQPDRPPAVDWASLAAEAKKFREDYPDHPQARTAARIELMARINGEEPEAEISRQIAEAVDEYIRDTRNDVRDRLELRIGFDGAMLWRQKHASYEARVQAQAERAGRIVRDFPDEPDGYGLQLSMARLAPHELGKALADLLLANPKTPARFVSMARRVSERASLLGRPLSLPGATSALAHAAGRPLVVYTWRSSDVGFSSILKRMGSVRGVEFIGINLDTDQVLARMSAHDLPGTQFFDGGDLDGPMARQLKLALHTSIYLVDGQGIVRDLDAHFDPHDSLARFLADQGGGR